MDGIHDVATAKTRIRELLAEIQVLQEELAEARKRGIARIHENKALEEKLLLAREQTVAAQSRHLLLEDVTHQTQEHLVALQAHHMDEKNMLQEALRRAQEQMQAQHASEHKALQNEKKVLQDEKKMLQDALRQAQTLLADAQSEKTACQEEVLRLRNEARFERRVEDAEAWAFPPYVPSMHEVLTSSYAAAEGQALDKPPAYAAVMARDNKPATPPESNHAPVNKMMPPELDRNAKDPEWYRMFVHLDECCQRACDLSKEITFERWKRTLQDYARSDFANEKPGDSYVCPRCGVAGNHYKIWCPGTESTSPYSAISDPTLPICSVGHSLHSMYRQVQSLFVGKPLGRGRLVKVFQNHKEVVRKKCPFHRYIYQQQGDEARADSGMVVR